MDLYQAGTHYKLVERSVKYGVLFIGLTFLAFIVFETVSYTHLIIVFAPKYLRKVF